MKATISTAKAGDIEVELVLRATMNEWMNIKLGLNGKGNYQSRYLESLIQWAIDKAAAEYHIDGTYDDATGLVVEDGRNE